MTISRILRSPAASGGNGNGAALIHAARSGGPDPLPKPSPRVADNPLLKLSDEQVRTSPSGHVQDANMARQLKDAALIRAGQGDFPAAERIAGRIRHPLDMYSALIEVGHLLMASDLQASLDLLGRAEARAEARVGELVRAHNL